MGAGADALADRARNLGLQCDCSHSELVPSEGYEKAWKQLSMPARMASLYAPVLSELKGPIVPLLMHESFEMWIMREQSVCIDTTAAGGNAVLLASET